MFHSTSPVVSITRKGLASLNISQNTCTVTKTNRLRLGSADAEEHVESDLDAVDEDETVLVGDELEVDGVDDGPDLPGSLAGGEQVALELVANDCERIAVDEAEVGEEDGHEEGAPEDLIDTNLAEDSLGIGSLDLGVEPVVEVVAGGSVVDETKDGEGDEALHVEGSSGDEDL